MSKAAQSDRYKTAEHRLQFEPARMQEREQIKRLNDEVTELSQNSLKLEVNVFGGAVGKAQMISKKIEIIILHFSCINTVV